MNFIDHLTPEQQERLISLPYRVGLWISRSDTSGGDDSDDKEMNALAALITGYAEEVFGSETVQHVISRTVAHRDEWPKWASMPDDVLDDCRQCVDWLAELVDEKELNAFRRHLLEIGESVALAFREVSDDMPLMQKIRLYASYYIRKFKAQMERRHYKSFDEFLNISLDEREALENLAETLDLDYI